MAKDKICKVNSEKETRRLFFTKSHSKCTCETVAVITELNIMRYYETNHGHCKKCSERAENLKQLETGILEHSRIYTTNVIWPQSSQTCGLMV